jgi:signal transduction histidine kinase
VGTLEFNKQKQKNLFLKIFNPGFESIAWQVLYRVEIMGIGMALVYLCYDLFFNEGPNNTVLIFSFLPFYILLLLLVLKFPDNRIVRNIAVCTNFISMASSFVFLGDGHYIKTSTVIDFSLSLLVITLVYQGRARIGWVLVHAATIFLFIILAFLSYDKNEVIVTKIPCCADLWFSYIEIFSRLLFIFILGLTFIQAYDKQRKLLVLKNNEVIHLNKNLEEMVRIRTEKLREYSSLNSHKVRAPLARIMGLMNLIALEKKGTGNETLDNYLNLLRITADELDGIIREINTHLSEQESSDEPYTPGLSSKIMITKDQNASPVKSPEPKAS